MKDLKEIDIILDDGRSSFCGGEIMRGHLVVDFEGQAEMQSIQVRFYGEGYSQVDNVQGSAKKANNTRKENIVDLRKVLFGLKPGDIAEKVPMHSQGRFAYDFNFMVPKYLPCSFESPMDREYGMAYIRYFLEATITRPWSKNASKLIGITINQIIDTSLPEYSFRPGCQTEKELGTCFPDGRLYLEAYLNDVCYNQSSTILITCRAENDSKRIMTSLYAKLFKRTRYRRKKESKTYLEVVTEFFGDRVLPKKTVCWDNLEFRIPDVGPTITKSKRVNVDYFVRVGMYQLFRDEIHVDLPIVIGTTKALLLEKRKSEEKNNQDLSICVDPSEGRELSEKGRQELRELAEMYKEMPFEGNRPPVQYFTAEERVNRRNQISTPRLAAEESDTLTISDDRSEISKSSDLLHSTGLLPHESPSRKVRSENNLYAASKQPMQPGSKTGKATPTDVGKYGDLWSRGSTPRENGASRPSVRKAASQPSIDARKAASAVLNEGKLRKTSMSASRSIERQQTGRKNVTQKKLDLKEVAAIAVGLGNARRKSSIKIISLGAGKGGTGGNNPEKTSAKESTSTERSGDGKIGDNELADHNAPRKIGNSTKNVGKSNERSSPGAKSKDGGKVGQIASSNSVASSLQTVNQKTVNQLGENRALRANGTVGERNGITKTLKNERLVNSKAKVSAANAFTKAASKKSLVPGKSAAKATGVSNMAERKKIGLSKTEDSSKTPRASVSTKQTSAQLEKDTKKRTLSPKTSPGLKKMSSTSISATMPEKVELNEVEDRASPDVTEEQIIYNKNNDDLENNNVGENEIVSEDTLVELNEQKIEAANDKEFGKTFDENKQNHTPSSTLQGESGQKTIDDEEEMKFIEQQSTESAPKTSIGAEGRDFNPHMPEEESRDNVKAPMVKSVSSNLLDNEDDENKRIEEDSTFSEHDQLKEFDGGALSQIVSESTRNNGIAQKKKPEMYEEDAIVPVVEAVNVESSAFSFEDFDRDFISENNSNGLGSEYTVTNLTNERATNLEDVSSNRERAPSLDEFELIESQLLGEGGAERKERVMEGDIGGKDQLKRLSVEGIDTKRMEELEEKSRIEGKDLRNSIGKYKGVRKAKESPKVDAVETIRTSEERKRNRDKTSLNDGKEGSTTKSATRKSSITQQKTMISKQIKQQSLPKDADSSKKRDQTKRKTSIKQNSSSDLKMKNVMDERQNGGNIESFPNGYANGSEASTDSVPNKIRASPLEDTQEKSIIITKDENENDVDGSSKAKIMWQRTFTNVRTMQSAERLRKKSILNIRVVEENHESKKEH